MVSFEDLNRTKVVKRVTFVKEGCKFFFNAQHLLLFLSRGERAFYDFLCEEMDEKNRVLISVGIRQKFVDRVKAVTSSKLSFSLGSVASFRRTLLDSGLLLS